MTDFSPLESALHECTPERIAASLRYLRKADAVLAALMPMSANTQVPPAAAVPEGYALNLAVAEGAIRKLVTLCPVTPPEAACMRSVVVGARALLAATQVPPAAVVPANVTPMRQPRADLARLVESINAAVYANGDGLSVTEAIGALELAKLELLKEQEQ